MASADSLSQLDDLRAELARVQAAVAEKEAAVASEAAAAADKLLAPFSRCCGRTSIKDIFSAGSGGKALVGATVTVGGWVKTGRVQGGAGIGFLELNDGSTPVNMQVVLPTSVADPDTLRQSGTSVVVEGVVKEPPPDAKGQAIELHATSVKFHGPCDAGKYPMGKKKMSMEYLREKLHMRARTNTIASVARIRNCLAFATHRFFQEAGFLYVHTPLITQSDCEGAGEMFQVTTLLAGADEAAKSPPPAPGALDALRREASAAGGAVKDAKAALKAGTGTQGQLDAALAELKAKKAAVEEAEERAKAVGGLPRNDDGSVDYKKDFFSKPTFLTVSGQLQGEFYACALTSIYTFGPTFRAENSHTSRHLAEFWMIEPEIAFADLVDDMACAEAYVRYCCQAVLDECPEDLAFISKMYDKEAVGRVTQVAGTSFARCTYTEGVRILEEAVKAGHKFEFPVSWGIDLASEHERYLSEVVFKRPTILYNYPKGIKAFYMRLNDDNETVAAMDVLVPKVGELIGGSQREERLDVLERRIKEAGLGTEEYSDYLDLRRYGTVTHSGFGLGFERLILFVTGMDNIRDVIPFPRWPGNAN